LFFLAFLASCTQISTISSKLISSIPQENSHALSWIGEFYCIFDLAKNKFWAISGHTCSKLVAMCMHLILTDYRVL